MEKLEQTAILLATYNGAAFLLEMLASLEAQTDRGWVCFIHDDGSSDGTAALLADWQRTHGGENGRYRILNGETAGGACANFFYLLSAVEAELYFFADQDDVWLPEKIEKSRARMRALQDEETNTHTDSVRSMNSGQTESVQTLSGGGTKEEASVNVSVQTGEIATEVPLAAFSDMTVTDENLHPTSDSFLKTIGRSGRRIRWQELLIDNPAAGCTMCINRPLRDRMLKLSRERLSEIEMHDGWAMLLAAVYGRTVFINEPLVLYRQHGSNEMGAVSESSLQKIRRNLSDLASGRFAAEKKAFHEKEQRLAALLLEMPDLPGEVRKTLQELQALPQKGKLQRMRWYRRNGLRREKGDLWMRLWV